MKLLNGQLPLHIIKELKLLRSVAINIDLGSSAFQAHFIFVDFVRKLLSTAIYTTYLFSLRYKFRFPFLNLGLTEYSLPDIWMCPNRSTWSVMSFSIRVEGIGQEIACALVIDDNYLFPEKCVQGFNTVFNS